jgi:hypothetical protein
MILAPRIARAAVLLALLSACAQAPADLSAQTAAQACAADADCSSGDLCIESACQGQALRHSDSLLVSPASASREVPAGVKPRKGWFTLYNLTTHNHSFAVACDSGAVPAPASGNLAWNSKVQVLLDLQAPAAGSSTVTCTVTSGTTKTFYGTFALTLKASGGGGPTPDFAVSASPAAIVLDPAKSGATTIAINPTGAFAGDVTLDIAGTPAGATATFDTSTVAGGSGTATLTVNAGTAAAGKSALTITAKSGSLSHTASVALTVNAPPPPPPAGDFTLAVAPASLSFDQGQSGSAQVSVAGANGFAGDVALSVSGLPAGAAATFDNSTVSGGRGQTGLTLTSGSAAAGSYKLTVTGVSGALSHAAALGLTLTVPPPTPDFTLSASPASLSLTAGGATGQSTVSVAPIGAFSRDVSLTVSGVPSGASASFGKGTVAGGSGSDTLAVTPGSAAPGSYTLTLTGSGGSATHSTSLHLTIAAAPSFALSVSPASLTVTAGGSGTSAVTVTGANGFSSAVSLAVSGLPSGVTAKFSPASVSGSGSSTLTLSTTSSAAGSATLTVTASGGGLSRTATVSLTINAAQCTPDTWGNWASGFFSTNCAGCHSWANSYTSVKSRQANNQAYISDGSMPQGGSLSSSDKQRVLAWLGCGSPQ